MDILEDHANFIDGEWLQGTGNELSSYNPATGKKLWQGNMVSKNELNRAIESSHQSFQHWSMLAMEKRIEPLKNFQKKIQDNADNLALMISMENGKPLWEAKQEVGAVISKVEISIQSYLERCANRETMYDNYKSSINYKPIGVFAILGPFNFPAHLPFGHIIPALLAGNCVVFKPSELTPMVAIKFIHYFESSGFPKGVINLVQGNSEIGEQLVSGKVNGILFVGSYSVGKKIHSINAGKPWQILALEMGGNNPLIISKTDDIQIAVNIALVSAFISSGQRCTCARRVILTNDVDQREFIELLVSKARSIKMGTYDQQPEPFMGPLISDSAARNVTQTLEHLISLGAKLLLKGDVSQHNPRIIGPNILEVSNISTPDQECFGPLLQIIKVTDLESAITEANNTEYGLSAGIVTDNEDEFRQFSSRINAGIVNWNMPLTGAVSNAPFGGVGKSGNFRPGAFFAADYCSYAFAGMHAIKKFDNNFPGF